MQEADEQDTCRICSAPAEPDQPLFYPCKCSGTIRYIHQDCLTTWLAHSKKKTCDVCKHSYSFTKVYAPDMPSHLPPILLVRRLIQHFFLGILFVVRAIAVAIIWLAVLPWVTVWTWRMYFSMGESTAWWISDRPRPADNESSTSLYQKVVYEPSIPAPKTILNRITAHPAWVSLSADIFTGQIIAALIVLTFVAVFLLREWISQNARPGIFEDEEVLADDQANPEVPPIAQQPQPQPQPAARRDFLVDPNGLAVQQQDAVRALDALRAREHVSLNDDTRYVPIINASHGEKSSGKQRDSGNEHPSQRPRFSTDDGAEQHEAEHLRNRAYNSRVKTARILAARRRAAFNDAQDRSTSSTPPLLPNDSPHQNFDFTFKAAPLPSATLEQDNETPSWLLASQTQDTVASTSSKTSIFPPVVLQPPSEVLPYSLRTYAPFSNTPTPNPLQVAPTSDFQSFASRRPPLPTFAFGTLGPESQFLMSPGRTPAESPNLATYRAPEELESEAAPSSKRSYFDLMDSDVEMADPEDVTHTRGEPDDGGQRNGGPDIHGGSAEASEERRNEGSIHGLELLSDSDESQEGTDEDEDEDDTQDEQLGDSDGEDGRLHEVLDDGDDEDEEEVDDDDDDDDIFFAEDEGEDDEQERGQQRQNDGALNQAGNAQANENEANGILLGDAGAGVDIDANEEVDGNVEDDMEGAMEAIGMRGPIYGVFQNAALMVFVLDTAIGLCIWIPFTIGKSTALLSLDPPRFLQILHLPIRGVRLITDPVVDSAAFLVTHFLLPPYLRLIRNICKLFTLLVSEFLSDDTIQDISSFSSKIYGESAELLSKPLAQIYSWPQFSGSKEVALLANTTEYLFPEFVRPVEPYFALLGRNVRLTSVKIEDTWTRLALGNGPAERIFAVVLGYFVVGLGLSLYLNLLNVGNAKSAGRAIRSAVRQQLLVIKVASFIFIELVTFPLGCGVVLDVCTVWLFPEANIQSRLAFFGQAPLTAMFYHWVAGTMFMYSFAVLLSGCRSVMRSGAMWFIKDPQDQNSHPIRDILERPTLTQLRKICISGVMYSVVVACVVGSVAGLLLLGSKSIMPFRWKNREPLSNVPVDLLFLHLVLPQTMQYFRPKRAMKQLATVVWRFLASRLRLTSYFFGGRYPQEEYTPKQWGGLLTGLLTGSWSYGVEPDAKRDGSFRRVPATDNLALPRDMRAIANVTEDGVPVDTESKELIAQQNAEAEKAKRDVEKDYMIVYIPPYFRYRIFFFILSLWIIGAVLLGVGVALPIQLGRSLFKLFTPREVHDGYSLIIGFYLLWGCYLVGKAIDRLDKRRQRVRAGDGPRANLRVLVLKRGLLWVAKMVYMAFFLGIVVPILVAFVIDLYIVLPIRFSLNPGMTPKIRVVDAWALGLLYAKIALHATQIHPPNQVTQGLEHIVSNGLLRPDPVSATKEVIGPLVGGLIGMILFPGCVFHLFRHFFPALEFDNKFIFMNVYPGIFVLAGLLRSAVVLYDMLSSWSQVIRDKEFLVELRLKNHEPEKENRKDASTTRTMPPVGTVDI